MAEDGQVPLHAERPKSSKKRFSFVSSSNRVQPILEGSSLPPAAESKTEQNEAQDDVSALQTSKKGSTRRRLKSAPLQGLKRRTKETSAPESVNSSGSTSPTPPSRASLADSGWLESESTRAQSELSMANRTAATDKMDDLQEFMSMVATKFTDLKRDWDELQTQRLQATEENEHLKQAHQRLIMQHRALQEKHLDLEHSSVELQEVNKKLQGEREEMSSGHLQAVKERDAIWQVMTAVQKEMAETVSAYYDMTPNGVRNKLNELATRLEKILHQSTAPLSAVSSESDGLLLQDVSSDHLSTVSADTKPLNDVLASERTSARKEKSRRGSRRASEPFVVAHDDTDQSSSIDTITDTVWLNDTTPPVPTSLGLDELWQKREGSKF